MNIFSKQMCKKKVAYMFFYLYLCRRKQERDKNMTTSTMRLQVPVTQIGWFEQMVKSMGWSFAKEDESKRSADVISPSLRRSINKARKESVAGETIRCESPEEMVKYFESL